MSTGDLVQPVLAPRFALSCSQELMTGLGELASELGGLRVHTHLAESTEEVEQVRSTFQDDDGYVSVYDRAGLLGARTILAHCIYLNEKEIRTMAEKGT